MPFFLVCGGGVFAQPVEGDASCLWRETFKEFVDIKANGESQVSSESEKRKKNKQQNLTRKSIQVLTSLQQAADWRFSRWI